MADTNQLAGQVNPTVNIETQLYDCPDATTFSGVVHVCNQGDSDARFDIRIAIDNAAVDAKQYICKNRSIKAGETLKVDDIKLEADDRIYVKASTPNMSFQAMGVETA